MVSKTDIKRLKIKEIYRRLEYYGYVVTGKKHKGKIYIEVEKKNSKTEAEKIFSLKISEKYARTMNLIGWFAEIIRLQTHNILENIIERSDLKEIIAIPKKGDIRFDKQTGVLYVTVRDKRKERIKNPEETIMITNCYIKYGKNLEFKLVYTKTFFEIIHPLLKAIEYWQIRRNKGL